MTAMKLDMSKEFDTVGWVFIEETLRAINYQHLFIAMIMWCIDTAGLSVSVNGELEGFSQAPGKSAIAVHYRPTFMLL